MSSFKELEAIVKTARRPTYGKPIANNTRVYPQINGGTAPDFYAIRFHATDILTFHRDGSFTVSMGGWDTVTTKQRLNQYLPNGYRVQSAGTGKGSHLYRYDPAHAVTTKRRRRTYKYEEQFYESPVWGQISDPDRCVCGHSRIEHESRGRDCQCRSRIGWWEKAEHERGVLIPCDCPGFLAQIGATKYGQTGEVERHSYQARVPIGWEMVDYVNPWIDLGSLSQSITVTKRGKAQRASFSQWRRVTQKDAILAWHLIPADGRMRHSGIPVKEGKTYSLDGEPELCVHGYHASKGIGDARRYYPGPIVCRVKVWGKVAEDYTKMAGTKRQVLWMVDMSKSEDYDEFVTQFFEDDLVKLVEREHEAQMRQKT